MNETPLADTIYMYNLFNHKHYCVGVIYIDPLATKEKYGSITEITYR